MAIALVVASGTQAQGMNYLGAKVLADHDEAALTPAEMEALLAAQGVAGGDSFGACSPPDSVAELTPFTVVMKLDASGKIVQTWLEGASRIAECFNAHISEKSLNKPPYAPFYTSFAMSWQAEPEQPGSQ
jgi:hypothetical protein